LEIFPKKFGKKFGNLSSEKRKELQKLIPDKIKNAEFIPTYDLQSKTLDGIHPTAAGHKIVAEKIYESIVK
jgi:lysophospholipase L1-like esterase